MKRWLGSIEMVAVLVFVFVLGLNVCEAKTNQVSATSAHAQGLFVPPAVPPTPAQARPVGPAGGAPINPAGITPINPGGPVPIRPRGVTLPNAGISTPANPGGVAPTRPSGATPVNPGGRTPANPVGTLRGNPVAVTPRNSGGVPVLVVPRQTTMVPPVNPIIVTPKPVPALPGTGIAPLPSPKVPPRTAPTPITAPAPAKQRH